MSTTDAQDVGSDDQQELTRFMLEQLSFNDIDEINEKKSGRKHRETSSNSTVDYVWLHGRLLPLAKPILVVERKA